VRRINSPPSLRRDLIAGKAEMPYKDRLGCIDKSADCRSEIDPKLQRSSRDKGSRMRRQGFHCRGDFHASVAEVLEWAT
jgi:hypothetical protein